MKITPEALRSQKDSLQRFRVLRAEPALNEVEGGELIFDG